MEIRISVQTANDCTSISTFTVRGSFLCPAYPALRKAVRDQTMLWTKVVVEPPLSPRLTDVILWEFTSKSAGKLNTLILRKCRRVTNIGLRRVVDANPMIKKVT